MPFIGARRSTRAERSLRRLLPAVAVLIAVAGCYDNSFPTVPDLTNVPQGSVAVGTEFSLERFDLEQSWILPPPISSSAVTYLYTEVGPGNNDPAPPPRFSYFKAVAPGREIITIHAQDEPWSFVDTVDVH